MISFRNDYSESAHTAVLDAISGLNGEQNEGYGMDVHSAAATRSIQKLLKKDAAIYYIPAGTQTNLLTISAFLRPYEGVICCSTGHINVHETGAIESTGHKVIAMPHVNGKLIPSAVEEVLISHQDVHMVQPKMVYITHSTELGTLYTKAELTALSEVCRKHGLLLFLDGARLGSGLASRYNDITLADLAALCDVFYIGGTKNGALFGEALVICNEALNEGFRFMIKNRGALLAKGYITGVQFEALFDKGEDSLYFQLARRANEQAEKIEAALREKGYPFLATPGGTNQLFPILPYEKIRTLEKEFAFNVDTSIDEGHAAVRFVTSWATRDDHVEALIKAL